MGGRAGGRVAGSEQRAFIEADLEGLDRRRTPWLLVNGHRPIYVDSTYKGAPDSDQVVAADLRASLEELFAAHGVDLTLHGHHHSYQRSCPVLQGKCIPPDAGGSPPSAVPLHTTATPCLLACVRSRPGVGEGEYPRACECGF